MNKENLKDTFVVNNENFIEAVEKIKNGNGECFDPIILYFYPLINRALIMSSLSEERNSIVSRVIVDYLALCINAHEPRMVKYEYVKYIYNHLMKDIKKRLEECKEVELMKNLAGKYKKYLSDSATVNFIRENINTTEYSILILFVVYDLSMDEISFIVRTTRCQVTSVVVSAQILLLKLGKKEKRLWRKRQKKN